MLADRLRDRIEHGDDGPLAADVEQLDAVEAGADLAGSRDRDHLTTVHGAGRLPDETFREQAHRHVVSVRLVDLERGELGVVRRVGALVAEVPTELEDRPEAGDEEPFEVELGRDAQGQVDAVGVDEGPEGASARSAVRRVEHGRLHLEEAGVGEAATDRADDRRAAAQQLDARPGARAGRSSVAGPWQRGPRRRRRGWGARTWPPSASVCARRLRVPERERPVVPSTRTRSPTSTNAVNWSRPVATEPRRVEQHLQPGVAVDDGGEDDAAVVTHLAHAPHHRERAPPVPALRVEVGERGRGDRRGADGVGVETGLAHPFDSRGTVAELVGTPRAERLDVDAGRGHLGGQRQVLGVELRRGAPQGGIAHEALRGPDRHGDLGQRDRVVVAEEPGLPRRLVLLVRAVEPLELPDAVEETEHRGADPRERPRPEPLGVLEDRPEHAEVERDPGEAELARAREELVHHELGDAVGRVGGPAHDVEGDSGTAPGHEGQEPDERPVGRRARSRAGPRRPRGRPTGPGPWRSRGRSLPGARPPRGPRARRARQHSARAGGVPAPRSRRGRPG